MLVEQLPLFKVGPTEDLECAMGAMIDATAYEKVVGYIEFARQHPADYEIVCGGTFDETDGWFVDPTVIRAFDPRAKLMEEEIFGPVLTVYVYPDAEYAETLSLCNGTSPYGLTGTIFAEDRGAIVEAEHLLRFAAGNLYINDKPTGAVVGRQPFGGGRGSGTNDKAGSLLNLLRWMSPRTIKESLLPATDWRRPHMF
jgi:1-pyrroline-5-carboxylate dehydrogenase